MKRSVTLSCAIAAPLLALAGQANAGIIGTVGDLAVISAPVSVRHGDLENNEQISLFLEATGLSLSEAATVDIIAEPGTFDRTRRVWPEPQGGPLGGPGGKPQFASDGLIDSYFLHFDIIGSDPEERLTREFLVTFEKPILALIFTGDASDAYLTGTTLDETDWIGEGATLYPKNDDLIRRGTLEASPDVEWFTISEDGKTLSGSMRVLGSNVDQVRVFTESVIVPTPGAATLALGGLGLMMRRRR